jgi:hypothetical protein
MAVMRPGMPRHMSAEFVCERHAHGGQRMG